MLYISGAQQLGASRSQLLFSTSPFLGVLLAWFMFGEPATAVQWGAAGLMMLGIALMLTSRHEHEPLTHAHPHAPDLHHRHDP